LSPDSLLRLWRYTNQSITYFLTYLLTKQRLVIDVFAYHAIICSSGPTTEAGFSYSDECAVPTPVKTILELFTPALSVPPKTGDAEPVHGRKPD